MSVRTLKLTIAYDGTDFAGWQRQTTERTVQAVIEDALAPIERGRVVITGAGRTDAGVHAAGQVASVTLNSTLASDALQRALNATLSEDVRILDVAEAAADFNARFHARHKTYRYVIFSEPVMPPQMRRYAWHVPQLLDFEAMRSASATLVGTHDFSAFQASGSDVNTTIREILRSQIIASEPHVIVYEVTATGFLRHMVRNIVGTLVDVGRGRLTVEDMSRIVASRDRASASATAPPHGLTLWQVDY